MIYTLTLNPAVDRELTVPEMAFDTVLRATRTQVDLGGKGFNVSRLLLSLGTASWAVGFLGGKAGELLQDGLRSLGIRTDFVWVPGETRTNICVVTPQGGHYLKVNEPGPPVSLDKQAELLEKITSLAQPADWWVLSGSLPPGVPEDFYARIIAMLNLSGAQALLDTTGEPLRLGCQAKPFLVKPNREEARALTGLALDSLPDLARAAERLRALGAQNTAISLGKTGALLHTGQGTWLAHSPQIVEKNPIGAGDSMVAGLVWALAGGKPLAEALGWGIASGAATASLDGTQVGTRALIEELHRQVQMERLDLNDQGMLSKQEKTI